MFYGSERERWWEVGGGGTGQYGGEVRLSSGMARGRATLSGIPLFRRESGRWGEK